MTDTKHASPGTVDTKSANWPVVAHSGLLKGKFHRPAIGLIELSTEVLMSAEIHKFMPECDFGIYTSRVEFGDDADIKGLAAMERHVNSAAGVGKTWGSCRHSAM